MCHDGNSAPLSDRYLNAQLAALYENAAECARTATNSSWDVKSAQYEKSKYTRALAQFHYYGRRAPKVVQSEDDLHFYASFEKPVLKFICNHDAALFITIKQGHLNLDYSKVVVGNGGVRADPKKKVALKDVKVIFRVGFERSNIKGRDSRIGNADSKHLIQMMILNYETAKLVAVDTTTLKELNTADVKDALKVYLAKYLDFLRHAGNHVLFDLPDFDDDKYRPRIDYSQHRDALDIDRLCGGVTVKSYDLAEINAHLQRQWAAHKRQALVGVGVGGVGERDALRVCLAEVSSQWLPNPSVDDQFYVQFGTPHVKALCSQEVIVFFEISDIWFFDGEDFATAKNVHYPGWTVAFIVNVLDYKVNSTTTVKLDFESMRFSRIHSKWDASATKFFNIIVKFFTQDYFSILVDYRMDVILVVDTAAGALVEFGGRGGSRGGSGYRSGEESASWSEGSESEEEGGDDGRVVIGAGGAAGGQIGVRVTVRVEVTVYQSIIAKLQLFGFDQVTSLSEDAVNAMFAALYREAGDAKHAEYGRLVRWERGALFRAQFRGVSVRLISGEVREGRAAHVDKAVVCIFVEGGSIATKKKSSNDKPWLTKVKNYLWPKESDEVEKTEFDDLTFVFEVDIKMVDDAELNSKDFAKRFHGSELYTSFHGNAYKFKHIVLDVRNARFLEDMSNTSSLGKDIDGVIRLELIQGYIREYLTQFADGGYHVVQSLPYLTNPSIKDSYAFTSVACRVVSKGEVTVKNCTYKRAAAEAPALLIYGVCGGRAMPPPDAIGWLTGWIVPSARRMTFGAVFLKKEVFLEGRLLGLLELVNRKTTLVPKFAGVIDGEWHYDLHTWDEDVYRKGKKCVWKERKEGQPEDALEYVWGHFDQWSHEHEGTYGDEKNGEYSLTCDTKNTVSFPTTYRSNDLKIVIKGKSSIKVKGKSEHQRWSKKTTASWEATIAVYSKPYGLVVDITNTQTPTFVESEVEGACQIDVLGLHKKYLSQINFTEIANDLRGLLCGAWQYTASSRHRYALASPVFTRAGDLVVQLVELKKGPTVGAVGVTNGSATGPAIAVQESSSTTTTVITSSRSNLMQSAKLDLPATFGYQNNGLSSSVSSLTDSPPLKTPALSPAAATFNPKSGAATTTTVPGFNGSAKSGSAAAKVVKEGAEEEL